MIVFLSMICIVLGKRKMKKKNIVFKVILGENMNV